ncbi:MAG: response regulator [Nitrososphaerota archaeon]
MSNNKRIVSVVDDEIHIAKLFYEALLENIDGISVLSFVDPVMAFQHFTDNHESYALVISDLRMPSLNGLELLKVKTLNPKVRTILMSAYNFEEDELYQKYMKEAVINSTIEKPVTMNRLYQRVRNELSIYHIVRSER